MYRRKEALWTAGARRPPKARAWARAARLHAEHHAQGCSGTHTGTRGAGSSPSHSFLRVTSNPDYSTGPRMLLIYLVTNYFLKSLHLHHGFWCKRPFVAQHRQTELFTVKLLSLTTAWQMLDGDRTLSGQKDVHLIWPAILHVEVNIFFGLSAQKLSKLPIESLILFWCVHIFICSYPV